MPREGVELKAERGANRISAAVFGACGSNEYAVLFRIIDREQPDEPEGQVIREFLAPHFNECLARPE